MRTMCAQSSILLPAPVHRRVHVAASRLIPDRKSHPAFWRHCWCATRQHGTASQQEQRGCFGWSWSWTPSWAELRWTTSDGLALSKVLLLCSKCLSVGLSLAGSPLLLLKYSRPPQPFHSLPPSPHLPGLSPRTQTLSCLLHRATSTQLCLAARPSEATRALTEVAAAYWKLARR